LSNYVDRGAHQSLHTRESPWRIAIAEDIFARNMIL
jgi:hypothetical protein